MKCIHEADISKYHTFGLQAKVRSLFFIKTYEDCLDFLKKAQLNKTITFIGEGSNLVFTKEYYPIDLAILQFKGIEVINKTSSHVLVRVAAGENWHQFVEHALNKGWYGLENLALIPGTVGAAPMQNIGAYGVQVGDFIKSVHVINLKNGEKLKLLNSECQFGYRESIFKKQSNAMLITHVDFKLLISPNINTSYPILNLKLKEHKNVTPYNVFKTVISIRKKKLPEASRLGNAGSFFKNPIVPNIQAEEVGEKLKQKLGKQVDIPFHDYTSTSKKIFAALLIDSCGWKGKKIGRIGVWEEHPLILVNHGNGTGQDLLQLVDSIKNSVKEEFKINLEVEPRIV